MEMNYASNAKGNLGVTLGAIGTGLAALNGGGNGLLGGVLGNNNGCHNYDRYDAQKDARIAELETEVKLRDANTYTLQQINGLRDYVETRLGRIEHEQCDQRVYNATNTAALTCLQGQVAQLMGLTKLVVPNASICPGWGNVTVTPAAAPTT